jgi:hypothetical protein
MRCPGVEEAIACKGTAVESAVFKVRKKTFLFVNTVHARLKLRESLAEATGLAAKEPGLYDVGALGWIKVTLGAEPEPPLELFERWIDESRRLVGGAERAVKPAATKSAQKSTTRKATVSRG